MKTYVAGKWVAEGAVEIGSRSEPRVQRFGDTLGRKTNGQSLDGVNMAKSGKNGSGQGERTDPLMWLKRAINDASFEDGVPRDDVAALDDLEKMIGNATPATVYGSLSTEALEAFVESLPSESIRDESRDALRERSQVARMTGGPGEFFRDVRRQKGVSLDTAAQALGTTADALEQVESGMRPWHELSAERLDRFAAAARVPYPWLLLRLRSAAKWQLLSDVEMRLQLKLGRHDSLRSDDEARSGSLHAALAAVRAQSIATKQFFDRARIPPKTKP